MGDRVQIGEPWGLHGVDTCWVLLPLGDSSAGATRSVPSPCRRPSALGSHDAPTIPASDGGGLGTSYRSGSPTGRGRTTMRRVPTTKGGRRYRRCPRSRPDYGTCRRLLPPEWENRVQRASHCTELLPETPSIPVQEEGFPPGGSIPSQGQ